MDSVTRPRVSELMLCVSDCPLHPELFECVTGHVIRRNRTTMKIGITPWGHVIEWTNGSVQITETTLTREMRLSPRLCRYECLLQGERCGKIELESVQYQVNSQLEILTPEIFVHFHDELERDAGRRGVSHHFRPKFRMGIAPLGFLAYEPVARGISISAFHTFPTEYAVIKTQTLIEID